MIFNTWTPALALKEDFTLLVEGARGRVVCKKAASLSRSGERLNPSR